MRKKVFDFYFLHLYLHYLGVNRQVESLLEIIGNYTLLHIKNHYWGRFTDLKRSLKTIELFSIVL